MGCESAEPSLPEYGDSSVDDVCHSFYVYPKRWMVQRRNLENGMDEITADTNVKTWDRVGAYIDGALKKRKREQDLT